MLTYASGDGTEYRVIVPSPSLPPPAVFLSNLILILTPLDYMFSLSYINIQALDGSLSTPHNGWRSLRILHLDLGILPCQA
mmetsp:Transcript_28145/g.56589  ORF Transcript_28145/g.56589 Transcript_28145/m.56589 type:complete len:81 (+) Transcript_28145:235-477(+)